MLNVGFPVRAAKPILHLVTPIECLLPLSLIQMSHSTQHIYMDPLVVSHSCYYYV